MTGRAMVLGALAGLALQSAACDNGRTYFDCGPGGCVDGDADTDADTDADADTDGETDADADAGTPDPCDAPVETCRDAADCFLAVSYRRCCPCPEALPGGRLCRDPVCIVPVEAATGRPDGCRACDESACDPCPTATGARCVDGLCVTSWAGECGVDEDCGAGRVCELVEGVARCVADPNECGRDEDCPGGQTCRDWLGLGFRTCWHPDSSCLGTFECDYNHFCEDPDGDGVYACFDRSPRCRPGFDSSDCGLGERCDDADGDGYGDCVPG